MGFGDEMLVKPGTIFMIVLIAAFGLAIFSWASDAINTTGKESLEDQSDSFTCSGMTVKVADLDIENDKVTVFFSINRDVDQVSLNFEGSRNITKTVEYPGYGQLRNVTVSLEQFEELSFKVANCNPQRFTAE